jgi:CDP-glucose 4,6-dehydratase
MIQFWRDRSVLVTGCTGLLGSGLVAELVQRGARVTGLVRDLVPKSRLYLEGWHQQMNIVPGYVEDLATIKRVLTEYEIDTVFHLAAQTQVGVAIEAPLATFETNIKGTWNVLEACRQVGRTSRILVASTGKVYGEQGELPYSETDALQGSYPYDVSKSCADLICRSYFMTYRLPVCVTRLSNLYGGGDLNLQRLIPDTIYSALQDRPVVIRSDGTSTRDYLYIRDGVLAYLLLAEQMERPEIVGETFNFSSGSSASVLDMVYTIWDLMGKKHWHPELANGSKQEIKYQSLDSTKARTMLNWSPQYSLKSGLKETIEWYTNLWSTKADVKVGTRRILV